MAHLCDSVIQFWQWESSNP